MLGEGGERSLRDFDLDDIAADLGEILRQRDELSLQAAARAGVLAEARYGELQGAVSTAEWMRHEYQLSTGGARDLVNVGLEMASLADSTQACEAHEIGFQHLAVLARAKRQLGDRRFFEAHLLAEAKEISVGRLWHRCQELRHAADPEGVEDEQRDAFERRELTLNQHPDGTVTLGARLDPVSGAVVKAAIAPLAQRCGRHDDRRLEQRQADALVEVCGHALEVGGGQGRRRPHLNVSLTCGTLLQVPESPAASTDYEALLPGVSVKRI